MILRSDDAAFGDGGCRVLTVSPRDVGHILAGWRAQQSSIRTDVLLTVSRVNATLDGEIAQYTRPMLQAVMQKDATNGVATTWLALKVREAERDADALMTTVLRADALWNAAIAPFAVFQRSRGVQPRYFQRDVTILSPVHAQEGAGQHAPGEAGLVVGIATYVALAGSLVRDVDTGRRFWQDLDLLMKTSTAHVAQVLNDPQIAPAWQWLRPEGMTRLLMSKHAEVRAIAMVKAPLLSKAAGVPVRDGADPLVPGEPVGRTSHRPKRGIPGPG